ncbi:uncharacterized protein LOC112904452 [Agrilus planipennis]|uniref:Uncharacterized protein LOC112904452 n=2 Tax=Agrilus planipennis TaxID=224129 RepID=A0A7F5R3R6_AGRPL|nr:uncharacterized protein LOC112904452 [Agrilus planipennis]
MHFTFFLTLICLTNFGIGQITVPNQFHFPYGDPVIPFIGLFVAIAFPVEINNVDLFFSVNLEANYNLPSNQTNFTYPPTVSNRNFPTISRLGVYRALEFKLEGHGYPGRECLLRMICECAEKNLDGNGILGDLINIILRPSYSLKENGSSVYDEAENYEKSNEHCEIYQDLCPFSILKLITWSDM